MNPPIGGAAGAINERGMGCWFSGTLRSLIFLTKFYGKARSDSVGCEGEIDKRLECGLSILKNLDPRMFCS